MVEERKFRIFLIFFFVIKSVAEFSGIRKKLRILQIFFVIKSVADLSGGGKKSEFY